MLRFKWITLILIALAPLAQADWGRLFFTPQERAAIDQGRVVATTSDTATSTSETPSWNYYSGAAQRDGGQPLHWVNGQRSHTSSPPKKVKPGESWNDQNGEVVPAGRALH